MRPMTPDQQKYYEELVEERGESRVKQCNECGWPTYLRLESCVWCDAKFPKVTLWMKFRERPFGIILILLIGFAPILLGIFAMLFNSIGDTD